MNNRGDLRRQACMKAALRRLELITPSDVVEWAIGKIAHGEVAEALVELAINDDRRALEVDTCLDSLLQEIGSPIPDMEHSAVVVARSVAGQIVANDIPAIDGARALWDIARRIPSIESRLNIFIGLTSEWDDSPSERAGYEADIRDEARRLIEELEHIYPDM